jgi:hypothetical protein
MGGGGIVFFSKREEITGDWRTLFNEELHNLHWSRGSSGSIVSDYGLDDRGSIPDRGRGFFFQLLRPDRPTQPPIQRVPGVLSPGIKCGRGVTLTTHPHLVPSLSMSRSCTFSPAHVPPWYVAGQLLRNIISVIRWGQAWDRWHMRKKH